MPVDAPVMTADCMVGSDLSCACCNLNGAERNQRASFRSEAGSSFAISNSDRLTYPAPVEGWGDRNHGKESEEGEEGGGKQGPGAGGNGARLSGHGDPRHGKARPPLFRGAQSGSRGFQHVRAGGKPAEKPRSGKRRKAHPL